MFICLYVAEVGARNWSVEINLCFKGIKYYGKSNIIERIFNAFGFQCLPKEDVDLKDLEPL